MITSAGGKEKTLLNASQTCIILGDEQREIIEEMKGDMNNSEFIREVIMAYAPKTENGEKMENKKLKVENIRLLKELKEYKRKEQIFTKHQEAIMTSIAGGFKAFAERRDVSDTPMKRQGWLESRCKGTGITVQSMLLFLDGLHLLDPIDTHIKKEITIERGERNE